MEVNVTAKISSTTVIRIKFYINNISKSNHTERADRNNLSKIVKKHIFTFKKTQ